MKNLRLRTVLTAAILFINTVCISLLYLIANSNMTAMMKQSEKENLYASLNAETRIIEEFVKHQEDSLASFSLADEVIEFLKAPDDDEKRAAAQSYTEKYYSGLDNWEGLYIGEWNTHVIAHSDPSYIGMTTRTGNPLKELQGEMENGLYNAGIIVSPASKKLILSLYCPVFDYDGKTIVGYVGGGPFVEELEELLASVEYKNAEYYMVNVKTDTYIFAQYEELMTTKIKDNTLLSIIAILTKNNDILTGDKEYTHKTKGESIAVYSYMPEYDWAVISCNSEKNIYADVDKSMNVLAVICIFSNILIGVLSWIIIRLSTKPLRYAAASIVQLKEMNLEKDHKLDKYINTKSEIGQISTAIDSLYDSIKEMLEAEKEKQAAIAANESKALFLASMSHEIRTPINAIIGMNEMIIRENENEEINEYAYSVKGASQMLLGIINDILDFSKIEVGRLQLVEGDYRVLNLLNDTVLGSENHIKEKNLEFIVDVDAELPSVLYGDEIRIKQVFNNLLSNAAKYTQKGSVEFTAKGVYTEEGFSLVVSVKDTGIGIKKEDLPNIFDRFTRLDTKKNRNIQGTGLGLNITKQLVENMNGKIEITSEYGEGSCFTVYIPQKIINDAPIGKFEQSYKHNVQAKPEPGTYFYAPEAKVLAVDDNGMNLRVIKALLKRSEVKLDLAPSGKKCLELTKNKKYDLILMDHMMPEPDGIETLRLIRSDKENINADTPVIALTANVTVGIEEIYLKEGFNGFLSKPIISDKLEELLKKLITE